MKTVPIGNLSSLIEIQRVVEGSDNAYGEADESWSSLARTWASIQSAGGVESLRSAAVEGQLTHKIVARFVAGVTTRDRISFSGRIFEIVSVADRFERRRYLDIVVKEVV